MFYSEFRLDRAEHLRKKPEELTKLAEAPEARLIPWQNARCLFVKKNDVYEPVFLSPLLRYSKHLDATVGHIFMGLNPDTKAPVFAAAVVDRDAFGVEIETVVSQSEWLSVRSIGPQIQNHDAALVAAVNGMMEWHTRNLYCGKTGQVMIPTSGGYARKLENSNRKTEFPRIDPAIICLVTSGDYCLLGRKPVWRERTRYSLLSGFLEVGETLEQAVEREVFEESGVKIDVKSVTYKGSQPWPFPQSLMVGFIASLPQQGSEISDAAKLAATETNVTEEELERYLGRPLPKPTPQLEEMEDVRWFHHDYIAENLSAAGNGAEFTVPESHAIANRIIHDWLSTVRSQKEQWVGDYFQDVKIDEGKFKYILARISDGAQSKIIVRGLRGRKYHMNIFEELKAEGEVVGVEVTPLGGGRIEHDASQGEISIYGYSSAFGTAVHEVTAVLCQRFFPFYERIKISYAGY